MFGQTMEIGQMEAVGLSYQKLDRMLEKLQQVTAEQVRAVANKYFNDDALTVGVSTRNRSTASRAARPSPPAIDENSHEKD